jgi:UDP-GlcNAc:undecaprenyl-phosphate/decaprenyl-phosphate GlcNAc-1-phosphate transferase
MPLLFNFIFDTFFTFIRRFLNGDNISQAHKTHLYQLLNQLGFNHKKITLIHYMMSISQGIGAIVLISISGDKRLLVFYLF